MVRGKIFGLAGATALLLSTATLPSTATLAADLPPPLPPPVYRPPAVVDCCGGWYIRADVGVGWQQFKEFQFNQTNVGSGAIWPPSWRIEQRDIKDTFFVGGGIGYQWNNWFRFDFTGEYRASTKFKALGSFTEFCPGGVRCFDLYDGDHQASVFLANFYFDLGTWWCLTPFVGFSAGGAFHRTAALTDIGSAGGGNVPIGFTLTDTSHWNFAWAGTAGIAYNVTNNFKVEFSYRYLNMGDVKTSEVLCGASGCGTGAGPRAFYTLTNFHSNDFRIGMRWLLQADAPPAYAPPPPLMRKG